MNADMQALKDYFETRKGFGVMSTADAEGNVDAAVYARPAVLEDGRLAVVMRDRLTHVNLESNPRAAYLFMEEGGGYQGRRLFLTMVGEEENGEMIEAVCRRCTPERLSAESATRFLVYFRVDRVLPLIGAGD